jgi:uncharacterized protein (TIGR00159 family)
MASADILPIFTMIVQMFSWREALDITILTVGLFFAYHPLRRLGTWKFVLGILIVIVVFLLAYLLDLTSVRWVYSNLSQVALISLIVIFQPEIRKILERAASLGGRKVIREETDLAELIADTTFEMANIKQGALIVLPGREAIQEWLAGGHPLDAAPSHPLIMSIFDDHSPGHDGAMVIENGKITRFGVRLPLSATGTLAEEYGTRHHAAMGLSEVSDALAIVVSEERGGVTIFHHGKMQAMEGRDGLRSRIIAHWENYLHHVDGPQKRKIPWVPFTETIISFGVACLIWAVLFVSQGPMIQKGVTVPITYTGLTKDMALMEERPTEAILYLAGTESDMARLEPSQMRLQVDLSTVTEGEYSFVITEEAVDLPKEIKLIGAEPSRLDLALEKLFVEEALVKPNLVGQLHEGLELIEIEVSPAHIPVLSPAHERGKGELSVPTKDISLDNIQKTTTVQTQIAAPPNLQPISEAWPEVEVKITVGNIDR